MKASAAKGHTKKHARAAKTKHHKTTKHHPVHHALSPHEKHMAHMTHIHAKAKHATHAKARSLALTADEVACCTTEALAVSLRLQGLLVTGRDVLDLFRAAGGDEDTGAPVKVMLEAASEFGLGGFRPAAFAELLPQQRGGSLLGLDLAGTPSALGRDRDAGRQVNEPDGKACDVAEYGHLDVRAVEQRVHAASLILGLDLPGPHAVLATPDGWWSWGELWCPCEFPDAVIEEAWAIEWAVAA